MEPCEAIQATAPKTRTACNRAVPRTLRPTRQRGNPAMLIRPAVKRCGPIRRGYKPKPVTLSRLIRSALGIVPGALIQTRLSNAQISSTTPQKIFC